MFKEFFLLELKRGLRQPMVYIFFFVLGLMVFGAVASDNVVIGGTIGNVYKNAPHVVASYVLILSLLSLLIAAAYFNNAALRDHEYKFYEILYATPLKKAGYFFGRFFGALILSTLPLLGIYLGFIISSSVSVAVGWLEPERIGPTPYASFATTYFFYLIPNMLFAGAVIFGLATRFKSTIISFTGALGIIVLYLVSGTLISDIENETIGALFDAFGIRTHFIDTKYFTPAEKNSITPGLSGNMLWNRITWTTLALVLLVVSFFRFSFRAKNKKVKSKKDESQKATQAASRPMVQQIFNGTTRWKHFTSFFKSTFRGIVKSPTFRILFLFSLIIYVIDLIQGFEAFGIQSYPVTYKMNDSIEGATAIFIYILLVFFSGELVWRDRMFNINEVIDATPHFSFRSLVGKALALISVVTMIDVFLIAIGMIYQALNGFYQIELDVYFGHLLIDRLPSYVFWTLTLFFIQVVVNQRYIGYFVSVLVIFVLDILWLILDVESKMLGPGSRPSLFYSDMNGFGDNVSAIWWFNAYWLLFAMLLLFLSSYLWPRGSRSVWKDRFNHMLLALRSREARPFFLFAILWLAIASVVFYNTQILNEYTTSDDFEALQVKYEKNFRQYENLPYPKLVSIDYEIDIFPEDRNVQVKAEGVYVNKSGEPINELHFTIDEAWNQEILIPNATLSFEDEDHMYRIYELSKPIAPDEEVHITFNCLFKPEGFKNSLSTRSIASNGTFINNKTFLPIFGYSEGFELSDKNDRRSNELRERNRVPKLQKTCDEACDVNYLTDGRADWVDVQTVISTSDDQIAIAPGSLVKKWKDNGRNYFQYKLDHPSQDFYSFMSARYKVARREWNGIDIEIYYHPQHPQNVEMMQNAVQRSLSYYTENFGPYYHKQARIIEFPRYQSFAQAFPGTMPFSEAIGYIADLRDEDENNIVDAVVAHEMAHQWWAHQEISAKMQGGTMLTESFAEYSSLMVMKQVSSLTQMRDFIKYDLDRYLNGRSQETEAEQPLYKVENQTYIHYGKGSVILYALQDYIGEDTVNAVMREFLADWAYQGPPYATSYDFLSHLEPRIPDSLKHLIDDWFKEITLYDHRLKEANYKQLDNGKYEVHLDVFAEKIKADSIGNERYLPPSDWIDIGLFSDQDEKDLMFEKRVRFDKEDMSFTFEVDSLPAKAAIDPRRLLIERVYSDNVKSLTEVD